MAITDPTDISNLILWLDAGAGITKDGSDRISAWADQGANSNDFSQGTSGNQPLFVTSVINGKPIVRFDRTRSDDMDTGGTPGTWATGATARHLFIIAAPKSSGATKTVLNYGPQSALNVFEVFYRGSVDNLRGEFNTANVTTTTVWSVDTFDISEVAYDGSDATIRWKGVTEDTLTVALNTTAGTVFLGSRGGSSIHFDGDIAEVVFYNKALSAVERQDVFNYLSRKYFDSTAPGAPDKVVRYRAKDAADEFHTAVTWRNPTDADFVGCHLGRALDSSASAPTHILEDDGDGTVSWVLLANSTDPYRLAGTTADTSPLQEESDRFGAWADPDQTDDNVALFVRSFDTIDNFSAFVKAVDGVTATIPPGPAVVIANPVIGDDQVTIDVSGTGGATANSFFRRAGTNEIPTTGETRSGDGPLTVTSMANRTMFELFVQTDDGAGNFSVSSRVLFVTPRASGASDLQNIITEIRNLMLLVPGIGNVHERRRLTRFWDKFYSRHKADGKLINWEITRTVREQAIDAVEGAATSEPFFQDLHLITIFGHMAIHEETESEIIFQKLIDDVADQIRVNNRLNNAVLLPRQLQVPAIGEETFGGVLCHMALMEFEAIPRVGG